MQLHIAPAVIICTAPCSVKHAPWKAQRTRNAASAVVAPVGTAHACLHVDASFRHQRRHLSPSVTSPRLPSPRPVSLAATLLDLVHGGPVFVRALVFLFDGVCIQFLELCDVTGWR